VIKCSNEKDIIRKTLWEPGIGLEPDVVERGDWKCRSKKCETGKIAGVENAGVSAMDGQSENKLKQRW